MPDPLYFRRAIGMAQGGAALASQFIVYVVRIDESRPAPGIIAVLGVFPPPWRPTENSGEAFYDRACTQTFVDCEVRRTAFKHYDRISEAEARTLYPEICAHVAMPRSADRRWWNAWERRGMERLLPFPLRDQRRENRYTAFWRRSR